MINPTFSDDAGSDLLAINAWLDFFLARGDYSADVRKHLDDAIASLSAARQMIDDQPALPPPTAAEFALGDRYDAYGHGQSAGGLWAATAASESWSRFCTWLESNRHKFNEDSLRQMGGTLTGNDAISQTDAEAFLLQFALALPPVTEPESVLFFADGFYWSAVQVRKQHFEARRQQAESARAGQAEHLAKFDAMAPGGYDGI